MNKYQEALDEIIKNYPDECVVYPLIDIQELVDRATQMKPIRFSDEKHIYIVNTEVCPNCKTVGHRDVLGFPTNKHCSECGQVIDWSED